MILARGGRSSALANVGEQAAACLAPGDLAVVQWFARRDVRGEVTRPMSLRPVLRWTLLATLVATAGALLLHAPDDFLYEPAGGGRASASDAPSSGAWTESHQAQEQRPSVPHLSDAHFDPFIGVAPPAPPSHSAPAPPAPPPPPAAPTMPLRFAGRMTDPVGEETVFLSGPDGTPVPIKPGTTLEGGYVVESVTPSSATLVYPPSGAHVAVPLEPAPDPSPR